MRREYKSPVTGSVWIHSVGVGQDVFAGSALLVLESMKMEIPILSEHNGRVVELVDPGTVVNEGDVVAVIDDGV